MKVYTYAASVHAENSAFAGSACAVIDVLRMTSVAVTAVSNGCAALRLIADEAGARREAEKENALLGGERNGLMLPGFQFGNSPLEYTKERISGRKIVMTTSNGARAVEKAQCAGRILLCSFLNVSAVSEALQSEDTVSILCAGTKDVFSLDDALCAGALAHRLNAADLCDLTLACRQLYLAGKEDLSKALSLAKHVQYLCSIGFEKDLAYCLREDALTCVPEMRADGWFR